MSQFATSEAASHQLGRLEQSVSRVRDLVNTPRRHHILLKDRTNFMSACSAMDILDDTIIALSSYVARGHVDQGQAYLEIFGVLQALTVQQDAVRALHRILKSTCINLEATFPDIKEIRDIRVRVAGHPVGGKASSHFLTRYTVSKRGFELWAYDKSGGRTTAKVDLFDLVERNSVALCTTLGELISHMESEDSAHKAAFADEKLVEIFNSSTYYSGKLFEGISQWDPIGKVGSRGLRSMVSRFKNALSQRSEHFSRAGFLSYEVQTLEHALNRYDQHLDAEEEQNEHDGYILARYIQVTVDELVQMAREIDDEYGA